MLEQEIGRVRAIPMAVARVAVLQHLIIMTSSVSLCNSLKAKGVVLHLAIPSWCSLLLAFKRC